ncbi:MAG: carboxy-S-adenosyl-L-methionine synthase CmoA [Gammaproteobacteria bacterium]|nr:carboxy-S-adenosyl-L-methionine synthase CmoA [Gammaproteobacteria bacterium]MBQ0839669.1 carboxy-S-adenosyl-L-methionine synthase CmoA [Gammaproteobacteria bacterium]
MSHDKLFSRPLADIAGFTFDADVVAVFPDMIQRSVPGYETIIAMTGTLAERYAQPQSKCYDLGCSLGASTLAMAQHIQVPDCSIVAIDNAPAMIEHCQTILRHENPSTGVELVCGDLLDTPLDNASMVVLNFTLQFLPPEARSALMQRIYDALRPGGILILSEKIAFADEHLNQLMIELHHSFKRANGYSELEVAQKRSALENVLIPETLDQHRQRLNSVGFASIDIWFQCFNFASLLAIK